MSLAIWYDQSGHNNHFVSQNGTAPALVIGGVLQTQSGYPSVRFGGSSAPAHLQPIATISSVSAVSLLVEKDNTGTQFGLFDGTAWIGGPSYDGGFDNVFDSTCDPSICGAGSIGLNQGSTTTPASATPFPPYVLTALTIVTANPASATTSISGLGYTTQAADQGYYTELIIWSNAAPSAENLQLTTQSQLPLTVLSQWCVNLPDATSCIQQQLNRWSGLTVTAPLDRIVWPVALVISFPPNIILNGRNATFALFASPTIGHGYYDYVICVNSNSSINNVTLTGAIASYGACTNGANLELAHLTIVGLGGTAIMVGGGVTGLVVRDSYVSRMGYGVLLNSEYISNVTVERCYFFNNTADAVAINSPVITNQQRTYFYTGYVSMNVFVLNNTMRSIVNLVDESQGFCVSSAGGQNVWIVGNDMSGCSWQGVHLEDLTNNVYIIGNRIDNVVGNPAVAWAGSMDGVWAGNAFQVLIEDNVFTNIPDACVDIPATGRICRLDQQATGSQPYVQSAIVVPYAYQTAHDVNITANSFVSWGTAGGGAAHHDDAVRVGYQPGQQDAFTRLSGNVYNASMSDAWIFCLCVNGNAVENVLLGDAQVVKAGGGCSGYLYGESVCAVATQVCS